MKQRILACLLAVWTALFVLPLAALACETEEGYQIQVEVIGGADHGRVELYTDRACAGERVLFLADPDDGYLVQIDGTLSGNVAYAGLDTYALTMPEGDVDLRIRFVPAKGGEYGITAAVNNGGWGELTISRTEAREGEYVVIQAVPRSGFVLERLTALGTDGLPVKGGYVDTRDGILIYEYCLPNAGVVIEAEFAEDRNSTPDRSALLLEQMRCLLRWVTELWCAALLP